MSIVITTTIDISSSPERVWEVLSDFSAYGAWSNFSRVDGEPSVGSTLRMRMPGFWFTSTVTEAAPHRRLQWEAKIITGSLFLGAHDFTFTPLGDGGTRVINTETFSGALTKPFEGLFAKGHNDSGYAEFNRALKSRVEARTALIAA